MEAAPLVVEAEAMRQCPMRCSTLSNRAVTVLNSNPDKPMTEVIPQPVDELSRVVPQAVVVNLRVPRLCLVEAEAHRHLRPHPRLQ